MTWREFLRRVEVKGPLGITFSVDNDMAVLSMRVPLVGTAQLGTLTQKFTLPPEGVSEPVMMSIAQSWARELYEHEMREQFTIDGVHVDPPHEHHYRDKIRW